MRRAGGWRAHAIVGLRAADREASVVGRSPVRRVARPTGPGVGEACSEVPAPEPGLRRGRVPRVAAASVSKVHFSAARPEVRRAE